MPAPLHHVCTDLVYAALVLTLRLSGCEYYTKFWFSSSQSNNLYSWHVLLQVFELTRGEHFALATAEQLMTQIEQEAVKNTAQPNSSISYKQPAAATAWEDEGEAMEAPDQLLSLLAMSDRLPNNSSSTTSDAAAASSAASTAAAAARLRMYDQVMTLFGQLLKSVTNSPACSPAIWGLYARWYQLQGHLLSSQEAYLKQVGNDYLSLYTYPCADHLALALAHLCLHTCCCAVVLRALLSLAHIAVHGSLCCHSCTLSLAQFSLTSTPCTNVVARLSLQTQILHVHPCTLILA